MSAQLLIKRYGVSFHLVGGFKPVLCQLKDNTDELFDHAVDVTVKAGAAKKGDTVVITAGIPLGMSGTTNMLKVRKING